MSTLKEKSSLDITATFSLNPVCTECHNLASIKELISTQRHYSADACFPHNSHVKIMKIDRLVKCPIGNTHTHTH